MELNDQQRHALTHAVRLAGTKAQACLVGYAGTGKTTTLRALVAALQARGVTPLVTAPTHTAVAVAAESLSCQSDTLHRTLGLSLDVRRDGEQVARSSGYTRSDFGYLIVDEASMVDEDLFALVCAAQQDSMIDWPVLWVGDPAQLPPVRGEGVSPVWGIEEQYRLTRIMRQEDGSGIIPLSLALRRCLERGERPSVELLREASRGAHDVAWSSGGAAAVARVLAEHMREGHDAIGIGWTNDRVAAIEAATLARLGREPRYQVGDEVIFGAQYGGRHGHKNNSRAYVLAIDPCEAVAGIECASVTLEVWGGTATVRAAVDWGVRRRVVEQVRSSVASLARRAEVDQGATKAHREMFDLLAWLREGVADLRLVVASTAHKAQGSTVDACVVDVGDMMRCRHDRELAQLLYVAVTRARSHVTLVA